MKGHEIQYWRVSIFAPKVTVNLLWSSSSDRIQGTQVSTLKIRILIVVLLPLYI